MLGGVPLLQIGLGLAVLGAVAWVVFLVGRHLNAQQRARESEARAQEAERMRSRREARLPGGSPAHPIEVASAAVIEPRAASLPCPRCGGPAHVEEHTVEHREQLRLRVTRMRCGTCGHRRPLYFVLRSSSDA